MYKKAFQTYKEIFVIVLIVAIGIPIASLFTSSSWAILFATAMLAFWAHRNILTGEKMGLKNNPDKNTHSPWAFIWRFAVLIFIPIILATIMTFTTVGISDTGIFTLVLLIISFILLGIILSLFGSVLPAASVKADASFSTAMKRGAPRFWSTLWKLIYGPVVISIFSAIIWVILYSLVSNIEMGPSMTTIIDVTIGFISGLISALSTVLVATILSQVYMDSEDLKATLKQQSG